MTDSCAATTAAASTVTLRSPADLVAGVPYLLGFHPDDSVVLLALADRAVACVARCDAGPEAPETLASQLLDAVAPARPTAVAVLGYGPEERVAATVDAVRRLAEHRALPVREALRVAHHRWWSYLCRNPRCCPAEGTPFDPRASAIAAACTVGGLSALPDRSELARQVGPLGGAARASMTRATDRAWRRLSHQLGALATEEEGSRAVLSEGITAVTAAIRRYGAAERLDDDAVAWLTVLLQSVPVRDAAWLAITSAQPHQQLWWDVTRRADPELVAPPASLLAFVAYRCGNGPLARLALERALAADPDYSMAQLLRHGLEHGVPPSALDGWGPVEPDATRSTDPARPDGPDQPTRSAPA